MTIDDDNSVYVGGFPYNATDDTLRRAFDIFGRIVSVKIINDHVPRGKCYAFVTFTNPQSAIDAINNMNGQTIGGRVVRVNGVTSRGGGVSSGQERFSHNEKRGMDDDKARNIRLRDNDHYRDQYEDRYSDRSRDRSRSRGHYRSPNHSRSRYRYEDEKRVYEYEGAHSRDNDLERDRVQDTDRIDKANVNEYSKVSDREHHLDQDEDKEIDVARTSQRFDQDKERLSRKLNSSEMNDGQSKEQSSNSREDHNDLTQLERSNHRHEEHKNEVSEMEESLKEKQQLALDLQRESKKLEDALIDAKNHSSRQQMMLRKLCKCFLQVKEYTEKLKNSEKELQALVETAMIECDMTSFPGNIKGSVPPNDDA